MKLISVPAAAVLLSSAPLRAQDHGHLNIGATSTSPGSQLTFDNGGDFGVASGYVKTLTFTNAGTYANLYQGNITLTALHAIDPFGDPIPGAPAPGSFVIAEIVSVSGPSGGAFQLWETNSAGVGPAVSIPTGTTNASFRFEISEASLGAGSPGGDPFGHIHGRRFTATRPGLYTIGFRALDESTNGPAGGPIHTPSEILQVYIEADVNILSVEPRNGEIQVSFAAPAGNSWQVEATDSLTTRNWIPIGSAVTGTDMIVQVVDTPANFATRFYRLKGTSTAP